MSGLNIYGTYLKEQAAPATTVLSGLAPDLATARGGTTLPAYPNLEIDATAPSFDVDEAINLGGTLALTSGGGTVTQSQPITVTNLALLGSGATYTLDGSNNVGTLAADVGTGSVNFNNGANDLSIGGVGGTDGVTAATLILTDTGTVTQSQAIAVTNLALLGSGGSFTLTHGSNSVGTLAADTGDITLVDAAALTVGTVGTTTGITTSGPLALTATGATSDIAINAAVSVFDSFTLNGARDITTSAAGTIDVGTFILAGGNWSQNTASLPSFSAGDFQIAGGTFLRATGGDGSSATPYQITDIYGLQGIGTYLTSSFALVNDIDASSAAFWNGGAGFVPIGAGSSFNGSFDGGGYVISYLMINRPFEDNVGLFGTLGGTADRVGLVAPEISGQQNVGALVGNNFGGTITSSYAIADIYGSGEVDGVGSVGGLVGLSAGIVSGSYANLNVYGTGNSIGGLIGFVGAGSVTNSYAMGTVFGDLVNASNVGDLIGSTNPGVTVSGSYATGSVEGNTAVGGLIGYNLATVTESYATGNVRGTDSIGGLVGWAASVTFGGSTFGSLENVFATGLVGGDPSSGSAHIGGLVGQNDGSINNAYATGAVAGDDIVGGLIGSNNAGATVTNVYASGLVTFVNSSTANFGALAGTNQGTITNGFWNTQTSGQTVAIGDDSGTSTTFADNTAQLQAALPAGFDSSVWRIIPGVSTPYLNWRFPSGPTVVSGSVTGIPGGNSGLVVGLGIDGLLLSDTVAAGADGSYQFMLDPQAVGAAALTFLTGGRFPSGSTSRFSNAVGDLVASAPGFTQGQATGLELASNRVLVVASASYDTMSSVAALMEQALYGPTGLNDIFAQAGSSIRFDVCGCSEVDFAPNTNFRLQSAAANLTFDVPFGDSLAPPSNIEIIGSGSIAINDFVYAERTILMTAPGDIAIGFGGFIEADGSGDAIVLAAGGNFINNAGAGVLDTPGGGRWLIYSNIPGSDTFGDLDSNNTAVWNATYATLPPTSVTQSGNRYLFAYQPTLTFTTTDVSKTYGDDATAAVAAAYSVSGLEPAVAGAFLGDAAASVYSGAPSVTSPGSAPTASVSGSPYAITAAVGSLTVGDGYAFQFTNTGALTVNRAALTVAANDDSKTYNGLAYSGGNGVSYTGLVNGESNAVLGGTLGYSGTSQGAVNAGSYVITPGGLTSSNYAISFVNGALTVNRAALTVAANDDSKTYNGLAYSGGNGVSYTGLVNGESNAVLGGTLGYSGTSQGAVNAGSYVITPGGLTSSNYAISFVNGALTVNRAALTVAANDDSKTYNGLAYSGGNGVSYTGLVNGESNAVLGGTLGYSGTSQGAVNAGSYVITPGGLTSSNYAISFVNGALTVNRAALTVAANDDSKTYNGLAYSGGNGVSYTGLVNGESNAVLGGTLGYSGTSQGAVNAGQLRHHAGRADLVELRHQLRQWRADGEPGGADGGGQR